MGYLLSLIVIFGVLSNSSALYADELASYRPSVDEVEQAVTSCISRGKPMNEKYVCPIGEFSPADNKTLSREKMVCDIQMALTFYAIDEEAKQWTQKLQQSREKNFNSWNEEIQNTVYSGENNFADKYTAVCRFTNWTIGADGGIGCAKTSNVFPETQCKNIAERKTLSLETVGNILASRGISKSYQNDKDRFLDATKTKYSTILSKWNAYLRNIQRAVSGVNTIIRDAVK